MSRASGRPTIDDVGREAGVSRATVTYVLSGGRYSSYVSEGTKGRVLAAVRRLGYKRNSAGAALRRGYSDTIVLLVVSSHMAMHHMDTIASVDRAGVAEGLDTIVRLAAHDNEAASFIDRIWSLNPFGLLVLWDTFALPADRINELKSAGLPIVDMLPSGIEGIGSVTADREQGFCTCAQYLIELGHKRIGIIGEVALRSRTADVKLAGYRRALEEAEIDFDSDLIELGPPGEFQAGYSALPALLGRHPDLTAVMATSDVVAIGALAAAADTGIAIPGDVSLAGYGGTAEHNYCRPRLTTMGASSAKLAEHAVRAVVRMRSEPGWQPDTVLEPIELILGESTGPPRRC